MYDVRVVIGYNHRMNDLRLLLQADKDRKIINLEFKYATPHAGRSAISNS